MKTSKVVLSVATLACSVLSLAGTVYGQEIEFASSPNPVGSGARALGMGGAFIAIADDATAASWNPAGLVQLELPEVSIVGAGLYRSEDNSFEENPESDGEDSISHLDLNYLSAAYPFAVMEKNMIVSLTYQTLYDFDRSWGFPRSVRDWSLTVESVLDYEQEGGLSAWGVSYAVQILDSLSAGITLNVWDDGIGQNNWAQKTNFDAGVSLGSSQADQVYRKLDDYEFQGVNCNIGVLWRINESFTLGGVYKAAFTGDVKHHESVSDIITSPYMVEPMWELEEQGNYDEELDMPASYGIGLSYRYSDNLSFALDLYRTEWDDMIYTDHEGNKTSAISGLSADESEIEATTQVRTGMEYLFINEQSIVPLRAGFFYDPAPSEGTTDEFYGITLGSGYARGRYVFDVGYQFRFGNDVGSTIVKGEEFSQDVREHALYTSLIVHF